MLRWNQRVRRCLGLFNTRDICVKPASGFTVSLSFIDNPCREKSCPQSPSALSDTVKSPYMSLSLDWVEVPPAARQEPTHPLTTHPLIDWLQHLLQYDLSIAIVFINCLLLPQAIRDSTRTKVIVSTVTQPWSWDAQKTLCELMNRPLLYAKTCPSIHVHPRQPLHLMSSIRQPLALTTTSTNIQKGPKVLRMGPSCWKGSLSMWSMSPWSPKLCLGTRCCITFLEMPLAFANYPSNPSTHPLTGSPPHHGPLRTPVCFFLLLASSV